MKRLICFILMIAILINCNAFVPIFMQKVNAQANIKIGDYLVMGKYRLREPILWRCVDIDENGPLMLSDKLLCYKTYDSPGTNNPDGKSSHSKDRGSPERSYSGSNYWGDSNIRSWLNSTEKAGNITWLCGNPPRDFERLRNYTNENGFLADDNFTEKERDAIKTVTQKSLISGYEYSYPFRMYSYMLNIGDDCTIQNIVRDYDSISGEQITDKVFLLDVKQLNRVYKNLGSYCLSSYRDYKESGREFGIAYFLRTPSTTIDNDVSCYVLIANKSYDKNNPNGLVSSSMVASNAGVRPAFYLNTECNFTSGDGSLSNAYTISGELKPPYININGELVQFTSDTGHPFIDQNGRLQVPLRATMEHLGATVGYDSKQGMSYVTKGKTTIYIPINQNYIIVNGNKVQNDTVAVIKNGRTYCPIRKVLESIEDDNGVGWSALWDSGIYEVSFDKFEYKDVLDLFK